EGQELFIFGNDANAAVGFLANDVAEHTTLFVDVVLLGSFQFLNDIDWKNWKSDQLRMGVLERGSGRLSVILENQDVFEPAVLLQIENAVAKGPENVLNA